MSWFEKAKATRRFIRAYTSYEIQLRHLVGNEEMKQQWINDKLATMLGLSGSTTMAIGSMSMATTTSTTTMGIPAK